jgi:predicted lipoprotein with Yx(FWY)xxD motif
MKQLTLAGWPLYRYIGDADAGQMNGQGKDSEWYAVTPSGQKSAASG